MNKSFNLRFKTYLSLFLIFSLMLPYFTIFAAETPKPKVGRIEFIRNFNRNILESTTISITGSNLDSANVNLYSNKGLLIESKDNGATGDYIEEQRNSGAIQYKIFNRSSNELNGNITVAGRTFNLYELRTMPRINSIDKRIIYNDDNKNPKNLEIIFGGENLEDLLKYEIYTDKDLTYNDYKVRTTYGNKGGDVTIKDFNPEYVMENGEQNKNQVKLNGKGIPAGLKTIQVVREKKFNEKDGKDPEVEDVTLRIQSNFNNLFAVLEKTDMSDMKMIPNAGASGDMITFESKGIKEGKVYEAYLISKEDKPEDIVFDYDTRTNKTRTKKLVILPDVSREKDYTYKKAIKTEDKTQNIGRLVFYVPEGIDPGNKTVVITEVDGVEEDEYNKPNQSKNPPVIISMNILKQNFSVINDSYRPRIEYLKPKEGSADYSTPQVIGRNLIFPKFPGLTEFNRNNPEKSISNIELNPDKSQLTLTYNEEGIRYDNGTGNGQLKVKKITRSFTGVLAKPIKFNEYQNDNSSKASFVPSSEDVLDIITSRIDDPNILNKPQTMQMQLTTSITVEVPMRDEKGDIIYEDGDGNVPKTEEVTDTIIQEIFKKDAYSYFAASVIPTIGKITPSLVQVLKTDPDKDNKRELVLNVKNNHLEEDQLLFSIEGDDFLLSSYVDDNGNRQLNYPIITILMNYIAEGNRYSEITIDKNANNGEGMIYYIDGTDDNQTRTKLTDLPFNFWLLDEKGNQLDKGNQIAKRIVFTLPKDIRFKSDGLKSLRVTNPKRTSSEAGLSSTKKDIFEVKKIDRSPNINSVKPFKVSTETKETIELIGTNIDLNAKVFIDGIEVKGVKASKVTDTTEKTRLEFQAPKARNYSVTTQLLVQNANGESATHAFSYIKAEYLDPKLKSINPNFGVADTMVVIKGENFIPRNPAVTSIENSSVDWDKLIGSKILIDGNDINLYNERLLQYKSDENNQYNQILTARKNLEDITKLDIQLADYANSIYLRKVTKKDSQGNYILGEEINYILSKNLLGEVVLSNAYGSEYYISATGEATNPDFIIRKKGDPSGEKLIVDNEGLRVEGDKYSEIKYLKMYTIYQFKKVNELVDKIDENGFVVRDEKTGKIEKVSQEYNKIVGNRVEVIDGNKIFVKVPSLGDIKKIVDFTVENPDKKSDSLRKAFTYYPNSNDPPEIDINGIYPNKGSITGNIAISIKGKNFREGIRIYFDGNEVPQKDIELKFDKNSKVANEIKLILPPYDDIDGEVTVPVTVINKDGASFTVKDGFTYMKPASSPKIIKIDKKSGSTNGKELVTITGEDFRFFEPYINLPDENGNIEPGYQEHDKYTNLNFNLNEKLSKIKWDNLLHGRMVDGKDGQKVDLWEPKTEDFDPIGEYEEYYTSNILPKIYFGNKIAKIVEFDSENITVVTPKHEEGVVDIKLVNNDSSISNAVKYTYELSKPKINAISPNEGSRIGGEHKVLLGELFAKYEIKAYQNNNADEPVQNSDRVNTRVRFADITNKWYKIGNDNYGKIYAGSTIVELPGGLKVHYKKDKKDKNDTSDKEYATVTLSIQENGRIYKRIFKKFDGNDTFFPASMLKADDDYYIPMGYKEKHKNDEKEFNTDHDYELIRMYIDDDDKRLIVERGYAPYAKYISDTEVAVKTPSYFSIGLVNVKLFNIDGSVATAKFNYTNPSSSPIITDAKPITIVKANTVENHTNFDERFVQSSVKGGTSIEVSGFDFREGVKIFIGEREVPITEIKVDKDNNAQTIIFVVPSGKETDIDIKQPIIIKNPDGGVASSIDTKTLGQDKRLIWFVYRKPLSSPNVKTIVPNKISQVGGAKIRVTGSDFRPGIKIILGSTNGIPIYPDKLDKLGYFLEFTTPADLSIGPKKLQLENSDFGTQVIQNAITVISAPEIFQISGESKLDSGAYSTEGGEELKLTGKNFYPGARVFVGGTRVALTDDLEDKTGVIGFYTDNNEYLLKNAIEVSSVKFVDNKTLIIKTPEVFDIKSLDVTVINADTGMSPADQKIDFKLPIPNQPVGLKVKIVDDRYIKLYDYRTTNFNYYDVYVYMGKNTTFDLKYNNYQDFRLIATTSTEPYKITRLDGIEKLDKNDRIYFVIRAVNNYGASDYSNIVYLKYEEFSKIKEYGAIDPNGYGEKDIDPNVTVRETNSGKNVDIFYPNLAFRQSPLLYIRSPRYHKSEKISIHMSPMVVNLNENEQLVQSEIFDVKFIPTDFNTSKLQALGMQSTDLLTLSFSYTNDFNKSNMLSKMPRNVVILSPVIEIDNRLTNVKRDVIVDDIKPFDMTFNLNSNKIQKSNNQKVYYFNDKDKRWQKIQSVKNPLTNQIIYKADKLGYYVLVK